MAGYARIPIISLYGNLIVSIQVELSDPLVEQLRDDLTARIAETGARGLVIDVSGIEMMDSYISRAIRDVGMMSKLMGARTVICGVNPVVAMTLVEMGLELAGVRSALNLEAALELLKPEEREESGLG